MRSKSILVLAVVVSYVITPFVFAGIGDGLLVHYEFEGNADDSSANNHDGIEMGDISYVDGVSGYAASFDGIDDYIDMGIKLGGYSAFSEFAWIRAKSLQSGNNHIMSSNWYVNDTLGNDGGSDLAITNGNVKSWVNQPDRTAHSMLVGTNIDLNKWHLIGLTWNGSTHKLYLDGDEVASESYTGYMGTSAKNSLIAAKNYGLGFTCFFNGDVDEVRVYNRALNNSEISELYAIPEPATLLLLSLGGLMLRRRK